MPEFICCGPNNACINAEHIISMEWYADYDCIEKPIKTFRDLWHYPEYLKPFREWQVRVTTVDGSVEYISAPHTAWFENFMGPMPETPKE